MAVLTVGSAKGSCGNWKAGIDPQSKSSQRTWLMFSLGQMFKMPLPGHSRRTGEGWFKLPEGREEVILVL